MTEKDRDDAEAREDRGETSGGQDPGSPRTANRKRMALFSVAILAAAGIGAFLLFVSRPGPERTKPEVVPPLVEVVEVDPRTERLTVFSQGTVRPVTESELAAQVSGRVVSVSPDLREGAFFDRGEVLVRIDPSDYRLAVQNAEAAVAQAEARLARIESEARVAREELDLLGAGDEASPLARYEPQLAEARSNLESARASVERARLDLARTTIEAPYAGRVRERRVDVGQIVAPGTPVASVFGTEAAEVRLPISKEDLGYLPEWIGLGATIGEGEETRVTLAGEIGGEVRRWTGRLVRTSGEIDPRTRMLSLFVRVDDPYGRDTGATGPSLPMGLFVEAEIPGRELTGVYVVPREALSSEGSLRVVGPAGRLQIRPVEIARSTEDRVVVREGLEPGSRVVVSRLDAVTDGMVVRVASGDEPAVDEPAGAGAPAAEGPTS